MSAPATFLAVAGNNDTSWRVDIPAKALGAKVIKIDQANGGRELTEPSLHGSFRWVLSSDGDPFYPDLEGSAAVWTRPDQNRATHAVAMYGQGKRIVAEVDDNYLAAPKFNMFMRQNYDAGTAEEIKRAYAPFDHVIVTTEALRDSFGRALKDFGIRPLPEFHVCGNHVDADEWPDRVPYSGPVRVGWMGSESHWRDITLAYSALKTASDLGAHVHLIGFDPRWRPQCKVKGRQKGETFGFGYQHTDWVDPRTWERREAWPLDIAVCPLERNEFTLGKSDVKVVEMGMSGAAVVCSDTIYGKTIVHGETGLIGSSREALQNHVVTLIRQPKLRAELAANLTQYVREERLITQKKNLDPWREACGIR